MNIIFLPSQPKKPQSSIYLLPVLLFASFLLFATSVQAQDPFITTWKTDNPGTSNDDQISIPINGSDYDFIIDWGDGNIATFHPGDDPINLTHTYLSAGIYTIEITGHFPRIFINDEGDKEKILSVEQWGDIEWTSMENAFWGAFNLEVNASDAPDLSAVTSLAGMFRGALSVNTVLNHWDVSGVTNMSSMFYEASSFNGDISSWDVSDVIYMTSMFFRASVFNVDIGDWDVSNVTSMNSMFQEASTFNKDISGWNVSNVITMNSMFSHATTFDTSLSGWNVSNVTIMNFMFLNASSFSQYLGGWNITSVTSMVDMLNNTALPINTYDATLGAWSSQAVQDDVELGANGLEYCSSADNRDVLISTFNWTITGDELAAGCGNTTSRPYITTWKTDNPGGSDDNQIKISTVQGTSYNFFIDWGDGQTDSGVSGDITHTYSAPGIYTIEISENYPRIWGGSDAEKLLSVEQWGDISWSSMRYAFTDALNMVLNATDAPDLSGVSGLDGMFFGATSMNSDLNHWDVSSINDMSGMFYYTANFNGDISNWNVSNVTNMSEMFAVSSFNGDISSWDVSSVQYMDGMFLDAISFNQDISGWNISGVRSTLLGMFYGATEFNQNLSSWDVTGISLLSNFFSNSGMSVENYDNTLSGWAAQSVENNVQLGAEGLEYCNDPARQMLIDDFNWSIEGDTLAEGCGDPLGAPAIPQLSVPANHATNMELPVTLQWDAATNADEYSIQVASDENFTTIVAEADSIPETEFEVDDLDSGSTYYWRVSSHGGGADSDWSTSWNFTVVTATSNQSGTEIPTDAALHQNYPNPFNPATMIGYDLPQSGDVRLEVFDMIGRRVALLVDRRAAAGHHQVSFDASRISSGIYIYQLQIDTGDKAGKIFTRKLTVIK